MPNLEQILQRITTDPRYQKNLPWGIPRQGHPEGSLRAHITQLEKNLAALAHKFSKDDQQKLKILIHTHDIFKPDATEGVRITDPRSHASLAKNFLAEFLPDPDLLNMLQYHDEPYALYLQFKSRGHFDQSRLHNLIALIKDWNLFLAFQIIDNCTPGKSRQPLLFLFTQLQGKIPTHLTPHDILP
jgi:hypothetical protein